MKRFIILLVALLAAVSAGAQTRARRFNGYVGGGFSAAMEFIAKRIYTEHSTWLER